MIFAASYLKFLQKIYSSLPAKGLLISS